MSRLKLTTRELEVGDVVLAHGLRVLVTDAPTRTYHADGRTYATSGRVLNRADVSSAHVPYSFTQVTTGWPEFRETGEHRWTLQGNDLAEWFVERS